MNFLYVFIGGGLGSLCRYLIGLLVPYSSSYIGTLIANLIACTILGILLGLNSKELLSSPQRLLLVTGFCGGFSTFSTFSAELLTMGQQGEVTLAIVYGVISIVLGITCILLGLWCAKVAAI